MVVALERFIRGRLPFLGELSFLYGKEQKGKTSFEVFLKHSTQKPTTAAVLAQLWHSNHSQSSLEALDIGTGEGTLHRLIVRDMFSLGYIQPMTFHLLDPSKEHYHELKGVRNTLAMHYPFYEAEIMRASWEDFDAQPDRYGVILCAHTIYHFKRADFSWIFRKMVKSLKDDGTLYVVARRKDQVYDFIRTFYEDAHRGRKRFNEITIDDAEPVLRNIVQEQQRSQYSYDSQAYVDLPFETDPEAAQIIVGFFLRKPWGKIPRKVRNRILDYFGRQDTSLEQVDGIVMVGGTIKST